MIDAKRRVLLACLAASTGACASHTPPSEPRPTATAAQIIELSQDAVRAQDAQDAAKLRGLFAPGYFSMRNGRFNNAEQTLEAMTRADPLRTTDRTFRAERVTLLGDTAVYVGYSRANVSRESVGKPVATERWLTLVWHRGPERWQLAHSQVQHAGLEAERYTWNMAFREALGFNLGPNRFLTEVVRDRKPGRALDVGMGQGRNALYLAAQGWQVTGIDIADEGIRQAEEVARREGLTIEALVADADAWDWGTEKWDLIALIYMGGRQWIDHVRRSLRPGGLLVIEFFLDDSVKGTGIGSFKRDELPALFADGFKVIRYEEVEDIADYGLTRKKLARFAAEKR